MGENFLMNLLVNFFSRSKSREAILLYLYTRRVVSLRLHECICALVRVCMSALLHGYIGTEGYVCVCVSAGVR
jgi:hypothetical protein